MLGGAKQTVAALLRCGHQELGGAQVPENTEKIRK